MSNFDKVDIERLLEKEETLDPSNWSNMKALAHEMVDDMFEYLEKIHERPVWVKTPEQTKEQLNKTLPQDGQSPNEIYNEFKTHILPYPKGNIHPRFWSWVQGTGTPFAMMAEMLGAGMNPNVSIGDHGAMYVEEQVIAWCKQMFNFPNTASGVLLSGGSMANITALMVARNNFEQLNIRQKGVQVLDKPLVVYASTETHSCIQKAAEACGLGSDAVRLIPINDAFQMRVDILKEKIIEDRTNGFTPFCVIGNVGTVNTGAIDPLDEILAISQSEKLWFHVDGAFGSLAKLVPEYQATLKAIEKADSLAFDFHKWMYLPYEVGCLLVKEQAIHRAAFALQPNYLLSHDRGLAAGPDPITNYGMELSRGFKSLKIWMSLKEHGIQKFGRLIRQNIAQAHYLGQLVQQEKRLELATPVTLNIVCFRYVPNDLSHYTTEAINDGNKEILMQLHEKGIGAPSYTVLHGNYVIRVCITNHRSRKEDFEALVKGVLDIGDLVFS